MAPDAKDSPLMAAEEQSFQTSSPVQQSSPEKLDPALDRTVYLTGWRLQVLSIRSAYAIITLNPPPPRS